MITGGISIAAFASGVGLPVGIALSGTSLLLSLATVITQKSFKTFTIKQEKHDSIKLLAQSKLDSIANIISQAMQDGDISSFVFIQFQGGILNVFTSSNRDVLFILFSSFL